MPTVLNSWRGVELALGSSQVGCNCGSSNPRWPATSFNMESIGIIFLKEFPQEYLNMNNLNGNDELVIEEDKIFLRSILFYIFSNLVCIPLFYFIYQRNYSPGFKPNIIILYIFISLVSITAMIDLIFVFLSFLNIPPRIKSLIFYGLGFLICAGNIVLWWLRTGRFDLNS